MTEFRDSFLVETGKLLDELGSLLLDSENKKELTAEATDKMFRILHTVKGSAGMMDLRAISELAHTQEELFVLLKRSGIPTGERRAVLFDLLFEALDAIREELLEYAADGKEHRDFSRLIGRLKDWRVAAEDRQVLRIRLRPDGGMEGVRAYLIVCALREVCPGIEYRPNGLDSDESASEIVLNDGLYLAFPSACEDAVLTALKKDAYVEHIIRARSLPDEDSPSPALPKGAADGAPFTESPGDEAEGSVSRSYVSVHLARLEELQRLINELILNQRQILWSADQSGSAAADALSRKSEAVRSAVVGLHMTPISALFQKLQRTVRAACRRLGRDIEFVAEGADVEVDKSILDALTESLMQLVLNAAVHGIEPEAERIAAGKPPRGKITVSAKYSGTSMAVTVSDDGRGISFQNALDAAGRSGGPSREMPKTQEELLKLLMLPGATTKPEADEMSGRGVGLDVVRSSIEKLRGSVTLKTVPGVGTAFSIRVPQSLAVMDCIRLGVGDAVFFLPTQDLHTLVLPRREDLIERPDGEPFMSFRGGSLPLTDLGRLYELRSGSPDLERGVFAILKDDLGTLAIFADRLLGAERAAVRPLPELINSLSREDRRFAGCAPLPDGGVGLILDAEILLRAKEAV